MRLMSFALTTPQILAQTKTVTRRLGWRRLTPGEYLQAVRKGQGLQKGERVERLAVLRVLSVEREPLRRMTDDLDYGVAECAREGFGDHPDYRWPSAFLAMFCATHGCTPLTEVARIEFEYVPASVAARLRQYAQRAKP